MKTMTTDRTKQISIQTNMQPIRFLAYGSLCENDIDFIHFVFSKIHANTILNTLSKFHLSTLLTYLWFHEYSLRFNTLWCQFSAVLSYHPWYNILNFRVHISKNLNAHHHRHFWIWSTTYSENFESHHRNTRSAIKQRQTSLVCISLIVWKCIDLIRACIRFGWMHS